MYVGLADVAYSSRVNRNRGLKSLKELHLACGLHQKTNPSPFRLPVLKSVVLKPAVLVSSAMLLELLVQED